MNVIELNKPYNKNLSQFITKIVDKNIYIGNINSNNISEINSILSKLPLSEEINIILQNVNNNTIINEKNILVSQRENFYVLQLSDNTKYGITTLPAGAYNLKQNNNNILSNLAAYKDNILITLISYDALNFIQSNYNTYDTVVNSKDSLLYLPSDARLQIDYVYGNNVINLGTVKVESFLNNYTESTLLYKVGLVSDIHYDDVDDALDNQDPSSLTNSSWDGGDSEFYPDLKNAFAFFNEQGVDFISSCGDITTADDCNGNTINHLNNFMYCYNLYGHNQNFFSCVGNHDVVLQNYNLTNRNYDYTWETVDCINNNLDITTKRINECKNSIGNYFSDPVGTSFYFTYKNDIYVYLNVCYGDFKLKGLRTKDTTYGDWGSHSPRKLTSSEAAEYGASSVGSTDYHLYNVDTIKWLESILVNNYNKRVFIFTHIMFGDGAGTYHGNDYYNYEANHTDTIKLTGLQGQKLVMLRTQYPNTIWFSGHSHMEFDWQRVDTKSIVCQHTSGAYSVHIPSLSRPLRVGTGYTTDHNNSEFAIMYVYNDHIEIDGFVAKDESGVYQATRTRSSYVDIIPTLNLRYFNADDLQYFTISSYSGDARPSTITYVTEGQYAGYLCFDMSNYHKFTFMPQEIINDPETNNAIYMIFEDVVMIPNEASGYDVNEYTVESILAALSEERFPRTFEGFGLYDGSTYITPYVNMTPQNILNYNPVNGIVLRLSQSGFRYLSTLGNSNSKYDTYIRNVGYKVYAKIKFAIFNIPLNYINKKTLISNYILTMPQH